MLCSRIAFAFTGLFIAVVGFVGITRGDTPSAASIESYFLPEPLAIGLSPDGKWYAVVIPQGNENAIYTREPTGTLGFRFTGASGRADQILWVANSQFAMRSREANRERISLTDPTGKVAYDFTPPNATSVSIITDQPSPTQTGRLIFVAKRADQPCNELFALAVPPEGVTSTFDTTRIVSNQLGIQQWLLSPQGAVLGGVVSRGARSTLYLAQGNEGDQSAWIEAYSEQLDRMPLFSGYGCPDGFLLAQGYFEGGYSKAVLFNMKTRTFERTVIAEGKSNLKNIYLSPDRRNIDAYARFDDLSTAQPQSAEYRNFAKRIIRETKVRDAIPLAVSNHYEKALLLQESDRTAPKYWYVDLEKKTSVLILDRGEALGGAPSVAMKPMGLKARDGTELPCFWTEPEHNNGGSPLVILVPGGPFEGIHRGWSGLIQALASRGVTVLAMNYRGARGYGRDFYQIGLGHAGDRMIEDVEDVVHAVVQSGTKWSKIVVLGTSYGGYLATRAALSQPQGIDQIALINPLVAPREFFNAAERDTGDQALAKFEKACWLGNSPVDELPALPNLRSPDIPIVIYQSENDERVSAETARRYINALTSSKSSARLVILNDDHSVARPESWVTITADLLESLKKE